MSEGPVRAVLWDADGVLQYTPPDSWDLAVEVVAQFPGAMTGAPIDEQRIRTVARRARPRRPRRGRPRGVVDVRAAGTESRGGRDGAGCRDGLLSRDQSGRVPGRPHAHERSLRRGPRRGVLLVRPRRSEALGRVLRAHRHRPSLLPSQLLFIDDQPANVTGARSVGLAAECWTHDDGVTRLRDILAAHAIPLDEAGPEWSEAELVEAQRITEMLMETSRVVRRSVVDLRRTSTPEDRPHLLLRLRDDADSVAVGRELNLELAQHSLAGAVALADSNGREL